MVAPKHTLTFAMASALAIATLPVVATEPSMTAVEGGRGGTYFQEVCSRFDQYLVGFKGRTGAWVTQIQILCGGFDYRHQAMGANLPMGTRYGGTGGTPQDARCPGRGAITSLTLGFTRGNDLSREFVDYVGLGCYPGGGSACLSSEDGCERPSFKHQQAKTSCPGGEVATGVHGRAGAYLDALGLICKPWPPPPHPEPGPTAADCRIYVEVAAKQVAESRTLDCRTTGPRWTENADDHFNWCMGLGTKPNYLKLTFSEIRARTEALTACQAAAKRGDVVGKPPSADIDLMKKPTDPADLGTRKPPRGNVFR